MKSAELTSLMTRMVMNRHPLPEWATFTELRDGTGFAHSGAIDVATFNCYPSKNGIRVAYEIKATRNDFAKEIDNPKKREWVEKYFHQTYFVIAHGICEAKEIPEGWGLLQLSKKHKILRRLVIAKHREVPDPPYWLMMSAMRRSVEDMHANNTKIRHIDGESFTTKEFEKLVEDSVSALRDNTNKKIAELYDQEREYRDLRTKLVQPLYTLLRLANEHYSIKCEDITSNMVHELLDKAVARELDSTVMNMRAAHSELGKLLKDLDTNKKT